MTLRVRILPDHVVNQIAAGEVVERPASVVKELAENALDAEARRVHILLRNGGKTEIRVSDDGTGMAREDALLALDRHATSKIRRADDLHTVASFGFRGEALPAIGAVSRLELETATGSGPGTRIRVAGGRILGVEEIARQPGTTVSVRSLFHNVPARAKFLRSNAAETRAASQVVLLLALSNLQIEVRLESNARELLHLPPARNLGDRVSAIWGSEEAAELLEVAASEGRMRVAGLVQRPDAVRPASRRRYLFVNGRPFTDAGLLKVADEAYRTTVPVDARPSLFLYVECPRDAVDVNVHPTKAEVRFRDRDAVEAAVRRTVREGLAALASTAPLGSTGPRIGLSERQRNGEAGSAIRTPRGPAPSEAQLAFFVREQSSGETAGEGPARPTGPQLWQLHRRYILTSTREGLLIIDQHSAHERVLFEEMMSRFTSGGGESQRLLFPITLRLSPAEYSATQELASLLNRLGFEIEPFGERTVIVQAAPRPHPHFSPERCLREVITELAEGSPLVNSARNQHERIAKSMACKGAIKAGQPLSDAEMAELIDRLFATELPGHDVHGRPTIVRLTLQELDRRFERS
ncbi:MAG: DNA mismatch repair endonuclease MutL [Gemmatimonadota bacterium]